MVAPVAPMITAALAPSRAAWAGSANCPLPVGSGTHDRLDVGLQRGDRVAPAVPRDQDHPVDPGCLQSFQVVGGWSREEHGDVDRRTGCDLLPERPQLSDALLD